MGKESEKNEECGETGKKEFLSYYIDQLPGLTRVHASRLGGLDQADGVLGLNIQSFLEGAY